MGFSQYRSSRINAVSSTGFITQGVARGKPLSVWNVLPTRNGILSTLLLMSFIVNLYFYLENQEVLHKLAISELENKNQDIKCEQVLTHTKLDQAEGLKATQHEELNKLHEKIERLQESAEKNAADARDAEKAKVEAIQEKAKMELELDVLSKERENDRSDNMEKLFDKIQSQHKSVANPYNNQFGAPVKNYDDIVKKDYDDIQKPVSFGLHTDFGDDSEKSDNNYDQQKESEYEDSEAGNESEGENESDAENNNSESVYQQQPEEAVIAQPTGGEVIPEQNNADSEADFSENENANVDAATYQQEEQNGDMNPPVYDDQDSDQNEPENMQEYQQPEAQQISDYQAQNVQNLDNNGEAVPEIQGDSIPEYQAMEPQNPGPVEYQQNEPQQIEPQQIQPEESEPQQSELQQLEPQQFEPEQAQIESESVESQQFEPQQAEPQQYQPVEQEAPVAAADINPPPQFQPFNPNDLPPPAAPPAGYQPFDSQPQLPQAQQQQPAQDPNQNFPDCNEYFKDAKNSGLPLPRNGLYRIMPDGLIKPMEVYCEFDSATGGWTRFQHRSAANINFNRTWDEYKWFFGNSEEDYWLGLEPLYRLTQECTNYCRLQIELENWFGDKMLVSHVGFYLENEKSLYRLHSGQHISTKLQDATDGAFREEDIHKEYGAAFSHQDGNFFSTYDRDNDGWTKNCAEKMGGGFWYSHCTNCNLNGKWYMYGSYKPLVAKDGLYWLSWRNGIRESYKTVTIRVQIP